jgi:hypothetical protein
MSNKEKKELLLEIAQLLVDIHNIKSKGILSTAEENAVSSLTATLMGKEKDYNKKYGVRPTWGNIENVIDFVNNNQ